MRQVCAYGMLVMAASGCPFDVFRIAQHLVCLVIVKQSSFPLPDVFGLELWIRAASMTIICFKLLVGQIMLEGGLVG